MATRSELIDAIIAKTAGWRGATLAKVRQIIHAADPGITEDVKWKRPSNPMGVPVFDHNGIVCVAAVLKERVRLKFVEGASLPDPKRLFNAELEGNKSRAIDFHEGDKLNETALKALIRAGVKHNEGKMKAAKGRAG